MLRGYCLFFFTLVFWVKAQVEDQLIDPLPPEVIEYFGTREMRHHHYLWHQVRNLWTRMDSDTQRKLTELGWAPPRPSQQYTENGSIPIENNDSGEDFFYMHRTMVEELNQILDQINAPRLVGFRLLPRPWSTKYPLPPSYEGSSKGLDDTVNDMKSEDFYHDRIVPYEERYKDPQYLRTLTLGQYGSRIEFTIHNWLHTRFSGYCKAGYRRRLVNDPLPDIDERWDNPEYDWLIDSYASAINPYFWKIHIWVDNRIQDWMDANNVTEIEWKGTWTGGPMSRVDEVIEAGEDIEMRGLLSENSEKKYKTVDVMKEVTEVLLRTGMESSLYDKVIIDEDIPIPPIKKCNKRKLI